MFRSQINVSGSFAGVEAKVDELARRAVNAAAQTARETAEAASSIDLELELIPASKAVGGDGGFVAGIRSRKKGRASSVEIANFFDSGTLGGRRKPPKGQRRGSWTVRRSSGAYTAQRHEIVDGKGIAAERFFLKARIAGRRSMVSVVKRGV